MGFLDSIFGTSEEREKINAIKKLLAGIKNEVNYVKKIFSIYQSTGDLQRLMNEYMVYRNALMAALDSALICIKDGKYVNDMDYEYKETLNRTPYLLTKIEAQSYIGILERSVTQKFDFSELPSYFRIILFSELSEEQVNGFVNLAILNFNLGQELRNVLDQSRDAVLKGIKVSKRKVSASSSSYTSSEEGSDVTPLRKKLKQKPDTRIKEDRKAA